MAFINIRTEARTIVRFKKMSWIWRRAFERTDLREELRKYQLIRLNVSDLSSGTSEKLENHLRKKKKVQSLLQNRGRYMSWLNELSVEPAETKGGKGCEAPRGTAGDPLLFYNRGGKSTTHFAGDARGEDRPHTRRVRLCLSKSLLRHHKKTQFSL